jgi:hypothetical protein
MTTSTTTASDFLDLSEQGTLRRLETLAYFMDSAIRIPGTSRRIGADGLLSFVPVVGSFTGTTISLYLLAEAWRMQAPAGTLARMGGNVALDMMLGAIPVAGPVFDFLFKANERNLKILRGHLEGARS